MPADLPQFTTYRFDQETFIHRDLWYTVRRLAELPKRDPGMTDDAQRAGLMLAACALEGYANFLLSIVDPPAFAAERERFRGQGLSGKLRHVARLARYAADGQAGPFQTICQLQDLRDGIAHPVPEQRSDTLKVRADYDPPMFVIPMFDRRLRNLPLQRVIDDSEQWCDGLQENVQRMTAIAHVDRPRVAGPALRGALGTSTLSPHSGPPWDGASAADD